LPEGEMVEYTDSSEVVTKGLFVEGEKEGPWISNDGDMKYEGEFKAGVKTGKWKSYYNGNGKIAEEGTYIDGLENGKFSFYYYNGKTKEEGEYLMGNKEGNWRKFDTEGTLYSTIVYKDNKEYKIDGIKVKEEENPIEEK
jgi:antitoxin component YwqK of YwqJK toxin-antitoxin module